MGAQPSAQVHTLLPLVAIVGATGTGKSDCAISLAQALRDRNISAEIVNADAMQLYRGMDIGTAKLSFESRGGVTHHLLDVWDVTEEASVADYQSMARATIRDIQSQGSLPILVGGSGLYVSSVLYEFEFPGTDPAIRQRLEDRAVREGLATLVAELSTRDPLAAAAIDPKNARRVIRALEVIELTGKPFGAGLDAEHRPWQSNTLIVGLHREREELIPALDQRVLDMWEGGFVEEVKGLIPHGIERGVTASKAIGYQQILEFLKGELSGKEAIESTQSLTRRYARRQVSWFRRDQNTLWLPSGDAYSVQQAVDMVLGAMD